MVEPLKHPNPCLQLPAVHYPRKAEGATVPVFKVTLDKPRLAQLPGGSGGQVLAARMAAGGRALWLWSNTTAGFEGWAALNSPGWGEGSCGSGRP